MDQVIQLQYRFELLDPDTTLSPDAPPLDVELAGFRCHLDGEQLTASPSDSWTSIDVARDALEPALRGWEAANELGHGPRFAFTFVGASVRRSADGGYQGVAVGTYVATLAAAATVALGAYPAPDPSLPVESELAHRLRLRWREQRQGQERLGSACYGVLTAFENTWGTRAKAAQALHVSGGVLNKLGELTGRDDPIHGRAEGKQRDPRGMSGEEIAWLGIATPRLILRVAEVEAGVPDLPLITLEDLPGIDDRQSDR